MAKKAAIGHGRRNTRPWATGRIIVLLTLFLAACSGSTTDVSESVSVAGSEMLVPLDSTEASSLTFDEIEQRWPGDELALGTDYQDSLGITPPVLERVSALEAETIINLLVNDYYELTDSGHRRDIALLALLVNRNNFGPLGDLLIEHGDGTSPVEASVEVTGLATVERDPAIVFDVTLDAATTEWTCLLLQFFSTRTDSREFLHLGGCFAGTTPPPEELGAR